MIKNVLTYSIFLFLLTIGSAQTHPESLFPSPGDTINIIKTELRSIPGENFYGSNNTWNFLFLNAPFVEELIFLKPQLGSAYSFFKDSDLMSLGSNGEENYYKTVNGNVIQVGKFGPNEGFLGDKYLINFSTSPVVKKENQKLNHRYDDFSSYNVDVPITRLANLGIEINMPLNTNEVRFQFDIDKKVTFDAQGDLLLPYGNYKVLRSKEEILIQCRIMVLSEMGWKELSDNFYTVNNSKIKLGYEAKTNFYFWSATHKMPILSLEQNRSGNFDVTYINEDLNSNLPKLNNSIKDVIAFPNPTFGEITFQLMNYPKGSYTLTIYDLVNKPKYSENFYVRDNGKINANLGFLRQGTYLYSILDQFGKKITTKRVVILRP